MDNFVKIPSSIILNQSLGEKRIIAFTSIMVSDWNGKDITSLVRYSKYSECRDKSGVLNQYKKLVDLFSEQGYFNMVDGGIVYIEKSERFGTVYYSEIQKILNLRDEYKRKNKRLNHAQLLLILSYIRLYMIRRKGFPEMHSNLLVRISENTGLSVRSISSCLKVLEQLEIIHNEELPRYKDKDGCWHSNVRIFVNIKRHGDTSYNWRHETSLSVKYVYANQID